MAKMNGEIAVNVVFREAVCRRCKWLDEIECRMLKFDPDDWEPSSVELGVRRSPSDAMTDCGFVTIANPDDFGCNKWEVK